MTRETGPLKTGLVDPAARGGYSRPGRSSRGTSPVRLTADTLCPGSLARPKTPVSQTGEHRFKSGSGYVILVIVPIKDPEERRAYFREYSRKRYADPVKRVIIIERVGRANAARRVTFRERIQLIKSQPCADCGGTFDPVCMDFDHLDPTAKEFNISEAAASGNVGWERIEAEIAKCEVVCANCHRLRSKNRGRKGVTAGFSARQREVSTRTGYQDTQGPFV